VTGNAREKEGLLEQWEVLTCGRMNVRVSALTCACVCVCVYVHAHVHTPRVTASPGPRTTQWRTQDLSIEGNCGRIGVSAHFKAHRRGSALGDDTHQPNHERLPQALPPRLRRHAYAGDAGVVEDHAQAGHASQAESTLSAATKEPDNVVVCGLDVDEVHVSRPQTLHSREQGTASKTAHRNRCVYPLAQGPVFAAHLFSVARPVELAYGINVHLVHRTARPTLCPPAPIRHAAQLAHRPACALMTTRLGDRAGSNAPRP